MVEGKAVQNKTKYP